MAAIIEVPDHHTTGRGASFVPHLGDSPVGLSAAPARPSRRALRRRVARRRGLSLVLAGVLLVAVFVGLRSTGSAAVAGQAGAGSAVEHVVVGPGDTLWSIAGELDPTAPRHEMVARLVELNGGGLVVELGDVVVLPSSRQ